VSEQYRSVFTLVHIQPSPYGGYRIVLIVPGLGRAYTWIMPRVKGQQGALLSERSFSWGSGRQPGKRGRREANRRQTTERNKVRLSGRATQPKTLVWIDDYEPGLPVYQALAESLGFRVLTASSGKTGLELVASHRVDAVVVDYEMPVMNGEAVAKLIKSNWPDLPVILFSGSSLLPGRVKHVVDAVCDKAGSRDALLSAIQRVLATKDHQRPPIPVVTSGQQQLA
jgi:CheY-like chemotaxis protein